MTVRNYEKRLLWRRREAWSSKEKCHKEVSMRGWAEGALTALDTTGEQGAKRLRLTKLCKASRKPWLP